jgi:sortase A
MLRASFVVAVLLMLILVVPLSGTPAPTPESVVERLTAAQANRSEAPASEDEEVAPEVEAALEPVPQIVPVTEAPELFVPLGRIEIPKVGLSMPIRNGVHERILEQGVGLWPGTGEETRNTVLSGHRTTYLAPFRDLDMLAPTDQVLLTSGGGPPEVYEVFDTQIVPEDAYVDFVLSEPPAPEDQILTMYACHPKGQRTHRIVVRARAVGEPQEVR